MRFVITLLLVFALAVALALFAGNNQGVVTVFWPPHRLDVSVNLALVVLLGLVFAVHVALQSMGALLRLPEQAREWRHRQKERAVVAALSQGMSYFLAGRFVRASSAAQDAWAIAESLGGLASAGSGAHDSRLRALAAWLAAESAHALQNKAGRDVLVEQAVRVADGAHRAALRPTAEGVALRQARWAMDDRDPQGALGLLNRLPPGVRRRTVALRMQLRAARSAGLPRQALEVTRILAKHGAFSSEAGAILRRSLSGDVLRTARDVAQLRAEWQSLDAAERAMPDVAMDAADCCLAVGGSAAQAREWLEPVWAKQGQLGHHHRLRLAGALAVALGGIDNAWLQKLESAQQAEPADPLLQFVAAQACAELQLWGKAQTLMARALPGLQAVSLRRAAALQLAALAERRGSAHELADALRIAAKP